MKTIFLLAVLFLSFSFAARAQTEQAPILEKELKYKNWSYKSVRGDDSINLRDFARDKKLVLVVYFAPWCPNWGHEAPFAQKLHEKYKDQGLGVIGVSEYDTIEATRLDLEKKGITFPVVFESDSKFAREKTPHYEYRKDAGDTRKWGSPWNVFLNPSAISKDGDVLVKKALVVNGELIEAEAEKFIRAELGLKTEPTAQTNR